MSEEVPGWRVGDRIVLTATQRQQSIVFTEERVIAAIEGKVLRVDKPLEFVHRGEKDHRGEVANLRRNVVVESADPEGVRGHTMYHRHSAGSISYTEFRHLGKKGALGRYSLHYHMCGDTMRGSSVLGASIHDSHNRFLTVHGTNYLVVRDCVGYKSLGHGFFLEDATEVFNVFDRNLAVRAQQGPGIANMAVQTVRIDLEKAEPFVRRLKNQDADMVRWTLVGNEGAGFWFPNGRNTFSRNVAAECGLGFYLQHFAGTWRTAPIYPVQQTDGSIRDVDIRALPFVRFDGNEVHSCPYGLRLDSGMPSSRERPPQYADKTRPFIVRDLRLWNSTEIFSRLDVLRLENPRIDKALFNVERWKKENRGWPKLIDDLPPTTVITHVTRVKGKVVVRGTTADNGVVRRVVVNGQEARSVGVNFAEWEVTLDGVPAGQLRLKAHAEDASKNVEPRPHTVIVAD